jgi:hypothetical protein
MHTDRSFFLKKIFYTVMNRGSNSYSRNIARYQSFCQRFLLQDTVVQYIHAVLALLEYKKPDQNTYKSGNDQLEVDRTSLRHI